MFNTSEPQFDEVPVPHHDIWDTEEAEAYEAFAHQLVTDKPAYIVVFNWLRNNLARRKLLYQDITILDVGCFKGLGTSMLSKELPYARVVGMDNSESEILEARRQYGSKNVKFICIPTDRPIGITGFSGAIMTFVHPTISDPTVLYNTIKKAADTLDEGSPLIMLGLHPNSLTQKPENSDYISYGHTLLPGTGYEDGQPFLNRLKKKGTEPFEFYDYCWTPETLLTMMRDAGMTDVRAIDLTLDNPEVSESLRSAIDNTMHGVDNPTDRLEWKVPLYQLYVGTKVAKA
jgi:SAM-dependent methyltransferase